MIEVERIGRYQILGELGRGAMGVVYRAHDPAIGRTVAIKTIRLGASSRPGEREQNLERLRREAQSAGRLSYSGIVTIYDMIEADDAAYVCMECVEGPTLERLMEARRPFSRDTIIGILRQTAAALDYAHSRGIVHRDIKPANIMLHEDRVVKITDFGIAKILSEEATLAGPMLGTPSYMSPEQIQARPVGGRSDQFSLAVIAYELLTGQKPFIGYSLASVVYKVCNEPAPPASQVNSSLPPAVNAVFDKALAKDATLRFADTTQFVSALEAALAGKSDWMPLPRGESKDDPTLAESPITRSVDTSQTVYRPAARSAAWAFGILGFAAVAVVFWLATQQQAPPIPPLPESPAASAPPAIATPPPAVTTPPEVVERKPSPAEELPAVPPKGQQPERAETAAATAPSAVTAYDFRIETRPDGATVTIDNISGFTCVTPCKLTLANGRHTLKIEREGYRTALKIVNVPEQALLSTPLDRRTGTVMVRSNPAGASILVNGTEWPSKTPTMMTLPVGKYKLEFRKEGHREEESNIEVRDGAVLNLDINWMQN